MRIHKKCPIATSTVVVVGWLSMIAAVGTLTAAIISSMVLAKSRSCSVGLRYAGVPPLFSCGVPNLLEVALGWLVAAIIYTGAAIAIVSTLMIVRRLILRQVGPGTRFAAVCYSASVGAVLLVTVANFVQTVITVPSLWESNVLFDSTALFTAPTLIICGIVVGVLSAIQGNHRRHQSDTP